jgi:G protein-coupled receptor GPR1
MDEALLRPDRLILLLVQSDFLKSMAFVIFPIVTLVHGEIPSDSTFCQVSGFVLSLGVESADIAVLLIALHSAMYIFRPRAGLYPYRKIAYLVFYLFPVITASLAFIGGNGYENNGYSCYLRSDTGWTRLTLSWIPRYFICVAIVFIYASIYMYIRKTMGDYGRRHSEACQQTQMLGGFNSPPPTPRLFRHGLLPSMPSSRRTSATDTISATKTRQRSETSISGMQLLSSRSSAEMPQQSPPIQWNWAGFTQSPPSENRRPSVDDADDPFSPSHPGLPPPPPARTNKSNLARIPDDDDQSANPLQQVSVHHLPPLTQQPSPQHIPILLQTDPLSPQRGAHTIRRRQLRSLLAYPLVYIVTWLFPFISHLLHTDEPVRGTEPRWLLVVSIISLCSQGAVDCVLFVVRERPWRYGDQRIRTWGQGRGGGDDGVGRSREEVLVDGRLARERREGEVLSERERVGSKGVKGGREWWEDWEGMVGETGEGQVR